MGIQDVVRWLLPKEDHFYEFLQKQAQVAHDAALVLREFVDADSGAEVRTRVQELEHKGDELFHGLEEALAKTFVTPIDREDLQKLSSELDDILDLINSAVRAASLYGVERPTEAMKRQFELLVECTRIINDAMVYLRKSDYEKLIEVIRGVRKLEKDADTAFREAMSHLFKSEEIDAKRLLREKEVLEGLENALDHCDRFAGTLANLAVKHG